MSPRGAQTTLPHRPATSPGSPALGTSPPGHPPIRAALQLLGAPAHASATRSEFRVRDAGQHFSGSVLVLFTQQDLHTPETGAVPSVPGGPVLRQMLGSHGGFTRIPSPFVRRLIVTKRSGRSHCFPDSDARGISRFRREHVRVFHVSRRVRRRAGQGSNQKVS